MSLPAYAPVAVEVAQQSGIRVLEVRCRATAHDRPYDEEHATETIALVTRGVFTHRTGRERTVLSPGWLMLGNAGQPFACSHEHGQDHGDDCTVLGFSGRAFELLRSAVGVRRGPKGFAAACLPVMPRVCALMHLLKDSSRRAGPEVDLSEVAFAVVSHVLRVLADSGSARAEAAASAPRERARIRDARQYIEAHADEPLSLETIAATVDVSPYHFLRTFRRQVGVTPHQYLIRARLGRAVALLRDTPLPITEVALEVGYGDLSNFVRTFHREIGCSPRDYRRGRMHFAP
jgi:AraC family transcriptional regulator